MPNRRRSRRARGCQASATCATSALGVAAAACALMVAGCTPPPVAGFDPQRSDVVAERGAARLLAADRLSELTGGRTAAASARIDSCVPGQDSLERRDPWSQRCTYGSSAAVELPDVATAAEVLAAGLTATGCRDAGQLTDLLGRWSTVNPGEPAPGEPGFSAAVLPPQYHRCGEAQVWIRFTTPDDPLLETTAAAAASTTDPLVVTARPYTAEEMRAMRDSGAGVIVLATVWRTYHEEPR